MNQIHKYTITLGTPHKKALDRIVEVNYPDWSISNVFEEFIEDYILRERGRMGNFKRANNQHIRYEE